MEWKCVCVCVGGGGGGGGHKLHEWKKVFVCSLTCLDIQ